MANVEEDKPMVDMDTVDTVVMKADQERDLMVLDLDQDMDQDQVLDHTKVDTMVDTEADTETLEAELDLTKEQNQNTEESYDKNDLFLLTFNKKVD